MAYYLAQIDHNYVNTQMQVDACKLKTHECKVREIAKAKSLAQGILNILSSYTLDGYNFIICMYLTQVHT